MLAEDSTLLREGLVRLLAEEGHQVLAAVGDGTALIREVEGRTPDIVVVDIRMPPTHTDEGLRAALEVRERRPEVGVLVLSQHVERSYAAQLPPRAPSGSAICSRTGSRRSRSSWTRWSGSGRAGPSSTRRSYGSW